MSCVEYLNSEIPIINHELIMSGLNMYGNDFCLKEEEKNEEKSLSEESNFQSFIKNEFFKEMSKNNASDEEDDDMDDTRRYIINYKPPSSKTESINNNQNNSIQNSSIQNNNSNNCKTSVNIFTVINTSNKTSTNKDNTPKNNHKKIFNIIKSPKNKKIFQCLLRKREFGERAKKYMLDWDNIVVPKEKHFHFDRKKHRIVFQRKHLKVIYSIVDLTYPFDFNKCFDMIKKHIGDKTVQNYGDGKSFHIIKINNEEKIVTLKDKKILLRENKHKKKLSNESKYTTNDTDNNQNLSTQNKIN